jgi:hypothetical protein
MPVLFPNRDGSVPKSIWGSVAVWNHSTVEQLCDSKTRRVAGTNQQILLTKKRYIGNQIKSVPE